MNRKKVEVDILVVVYAIRYGMGRMTYANDDAASLARRFWGDFDESTRQQIRSDADLLSLPLRRPWYWVEDEK